MNETRRFEEGDICIHIRVRQESKIIKTQITTARVVAGLLRAHKMQLISIPPIFNKQF